MSIYNSYTQIDQITQNITLMVSYSNYMLFVPLCPELIPILICSKTFYDFATNNNHLSLFLF